MIHITPRIPIETIKELIRDAERRHGTRLCIEDFDFLVGSSTILLHTAIDKFVAGAKEHHIPNQDFVSSVDHNTEARKEIIDLWHYNLAMNQKK